MLTVWLFPNSVIRTQWIILTQKNTLHRFNCPHNNLQWYQNTCNINFQFVKKKSLWIVYLIQLKCKSFLFRLESTCKRNIEFQWQIQWCYVTKLIVSLKYRKRHIIEGKIHGILIEKCSTFDVMTYFWRHVNGSAACIYTQVYWTSERSKLWRKIDNIFLFLFMFLLNKSRLKVLIN